MFNPVWWLYSSTLQWCGKTRHPKQIRTALLPSKYQQYWTWKPHVELVALPDLLLQLILPTPLLATPAAATPYILLLLLL